MRLICTNCLHEINIDDSKIPANKPFKVKCAKCSELIAGKSKSRSTYPENLSPPDLSEWERFKPFVEQLVNQQIAALRQELMGVRSSQVSNNDGAANYPPSPRKALVCEANPKIEQEVSTMLSEMGYQPDSVKSPKDALKKLEEDEFELIATDSSFPDDPSGGAKILAKMNAKKFDERRRTFVVLVSAKLETAGPENAFVHGANLTVNLKDLKNLEQLIHQGQREFQKLST